MMVIDPKLVVLRSIQSAHLLLKVVEDLKSRFCFQPCDNRMDW